MAELDGRTSRSMRGIVDVQLVAKLKRLRSRASRHGDQWVKEAEDTTADASYGFIRANAEAVGFHNVLRELEERSRKPESEAAAVGERLLDELLEASATSDGVTEDSSQEHCDDQDEGEEDDDAVVLPQAEVASMIAQFSETSRENKIEAVKSLPRAKVISFVKLSLIARQRAKSTLGKIEEDKEDKSASEEKNAVESAQLEEVFRHVQNDSPDEAVAYLKSLPKATSDEAVRIVALARINTRELADVPELTDDSKHGSKEETDVNYRSASRQGSKEEHNVVCTPEGRGTVGVVGESQKDASEGDDPGRSPETYKTWWLRSFCCGK